MIKQLRLTLGAGLLAIGLIATASAAPDLGGPWEFTVEVPALKTVDGKTPPLTAAGRKLHQAYQQALTSDPLKKCLPPGIPRIMMQKGFPFDLVIGQDLAGMFFEWNHMPRPIYLDIEHFENIGPTYLGQSVAKWEGDTLVVHTNGYNDATWLDATGLPHSEDLVTVERIRLKSPDELENRITFTDARMFTKPWTAVLTFTRRPGYSVKEDYCLQRAGLVDSKE